MLTAAIAVNHLVHQQTHGEAIKQGLTRHGIAARFVNGDTVVPEADFHVTWGAQQKRPKIFAWSQQHGKPVLVMERGHVGDRMNWTSIGWNGLNGRGTYARVEDGGKRWRTYWHHLLQPCRPAAPRGGVALVLGQVEGDAALAHLRAGFRAWAQTQTDELQMLGYAVRYRPHPKTRERGDGWHPIGATSSVEETLWTDLQDVTLAVSYNSTAGVEAVLAGVPTVTMDEGAMAWPVSVHTLDEAATAPMIDREPWCHGLAWTQFCLEEIRSGEMWEAVNHAKG